MNTNALRQAILSFAKSLGGQTVSGINKVAQNIAGWASPPALSPVAEPQRSSLFNRGGVQQAVNNVVALASLQPQLVRPFVSRTNTTSTTPTPTTIPTRSQTPVTQSIATPTPFPTRTIPSPSIRITIPSANGPGQTVVPEPAATAIFKAFDPYKEATNAAQVLHHPMQVSGTPDEISRGFNWWGNIGENPKFSSTAVNKNPTGSVDTGLFQINSDTFKGMLADKFWGPAMARRGITSYEQMKDPYKNAQMAMLVLMRKNFERTQGTMLPQPNYLQWYGAPRALRLR